MMSWALDCQEEHQKFCPMAENGKPELINCLTQNERKLGMLCLKSLMAMKDKSKKTNLCFDDIGKFCPDIQGKDRALTLCLMKHEGNLSPTCAKDLVKKKDILNSKEPCAQDLIGKCYDTLSGDPGLSTRCLFKNKGKLLARCESWVTARMQKMRSKNPCFDDTEKLCPNMSMLGQIDTCLSGKLSSLTPACKLRVEAEMKKSAADPCRRDIRTFCKPGKPREINQCLTENSMKLSRACTDHRQALELRVKKMSEACDVDRLKYCGKMLPTGGKIMQCLKQNKTRLSPTCASLLPK
jgi:hypothetical protein